MKTELLVEYDNNQTDTDSFFSVVKEDWKSRGNRIKDIDKITLYFKPQEKKCYYVINDEYKNFFEVQ